MQSISLASVRLMKCNVNSLIADPLYSRKLSCCILYTYWKENQHTELGSKHEKKRKGITITTLNRIVNMELTLKNESTYRRNIRYRVQSTHGINITKWKWVSIMELTLQKNEIKYGVNITGWTNRRNCNLQLPNVPKYGITLKNKLTYEINIIVAGRPHG